MPITLYALIIKGGNMNTLKAITIIALFSFVIGCGGGGGSNSSSSGGSVTYNGSSSQVTISESNAESLATNAYENSNSMRSMQDSGDILSAVKGNNSGSQGSRPFSMALAQTVMDLMKQAKINNPSASGLIAAVYSESLPSDCGGSASMSGTMNESTLAFNITSTFSNYCTNGDGITGGVVTNGVMQMEGSFNQSRTSMTMDVTFNNFLVTLINTGVSAATSGTMEMTMSSSSATITMNMVMRDNSTENTYQVVNLLINMYGMSSNEAYFSMSGRFYDPDYGYSDITTEADFYMILSDNAPSDGTMLITGASGSAGGSTKAKLIVLNSTQYQVIADTNGDGSYDFDTGSRTW